MPDVYPHGYVVVDGRKVRPPRFYDQLFKSVDPVGYEILSFDRYLEMRKHLDDMVGERLAARERVALANYSQLVRPL